MRTLECDEVTQCECTPGWYIQQEHVRHEVQILLHAIVDDVVDLRDEVLESRELREETGIVSAAPTTPLVYDLDHHGLSSRFGRCASHLDIGIAVIVDPEIALTVSDESEDVRWWPVDALPAEVPPQLEPRLVGLRERLRSQR